MPLSQTQQLSNLLNEAHHILIALPSETKTDAITAACAASEFLISQGKHVDVVCDNFTLPKKLEFLAGTNDIRPRLPHIQKFLLSIDVADSGVEELSYDIRDQKLHIFITPKTGRLSTENIQTAQSQFRYDLILTFGAPDLNSLGGIFTRNTDLFFSQPIVNFDTSLANESYGQLNMIDPQTSSVSELFAKIVVAQDKHLVSSTMANLLLTGMIAKTQSFKSEHVKPQTLALASTLIDLGADRQHIIKQLYQKKSLAMLKLWGQALSHMQYHEALGLVSSTITRDDFIRTGAKKHDLEDIIEELITNSPEEHMTLLLNEDVSGETTHIEGIFHVEKSLNAKKILQSLDTIEGDDDQVTFVLRDMSLKEAEEFVVGVIRKSVQ